MIIFKLALLLPAMMLELMALLVAWALARPCPGAALRVSMLAERLPDPCWYFRPRKQVNSEQDQG